MARMWTLIAAILGLCVSPAFGQKKPVPAKLDQPGTFAQELAAARKAGLPTTPKELAVPMPPAARNAATYYVRLDKLLKSKPIVAPDTAPDEVVSLLHPTPSQIASVRRALSDRRDVVDLIHRGAGCEWCVFKRDWSLGPALMFPEYSRLRTAARWLAAESMLQQIDGRPMDAVHTAALGLRLARHVESDPTIIAYLVARAIDAATVSSLSNIVDRAQGDPAVVRAVERAVDAGVSTRGFGHFLQGEVVIDLVSLDMVRHEGPKALAELTSGSRKRFTDKVDPRRWPAVCDANGAYLLWHMRHAAAALDLPYRAQQNALGRLQADLEARARKQPLSVLVADVCLPLYSVIAESAAHNVAATRCFLAGCALLEWKARRGVFPASLDQAMSPPTDPFDLRPLRYRREGSGFVVWSVGQSGKFDGGAPTSKPNSRESLFRWPKPAYAR